MGKIKKNEQLHVDLALAARQSLTSLKYENNIIMSHISVFGVFGSFFHVFQISNELFSGEQET